MLQEAGLCVLNTTCQGQRGVEGAKEAESPGETAGLQQLDPGSSLGIVGQEAFLEFGKRAEVRCSIRRPGWGPPGLSAPASWAGPGLP